MKSIQQSNSLPKSTQLNGTPDTTVKQPQSSNKKKSAKSAASVESMNPTDTVGNAKAVNYVQSPQLFSDEIGIADETKSVKKSDAAVTTDKPIESKSSDSADTLPQSDKHKSTDLSVVVTEPTVMTEPSSADLPNEASEPTATAEPSTVDSTDTIIAPGTTTAKAQPDTSAITDETKATRVSRKQCREELEDYKAVYLAPLKIGKRHTVVLDDDLWNELDYIVRRIGDSKANATAYANSIIRNHLNEIRQKVEAWRKLWGSAHKLAIITKAIIITAIKPSGTL